MLNKDILGIIRIDVKRARKPKKSMEDYLIGDDEVLEESIRDKRKKVVDEVIDDLDEKIGGDYGEDKKSKPQLKMIDFGALNKKMAKEQIRELKREYITLYETLEDVSDELAKETSDKYEVQIKYEYIRKEMKEFKRVFREILNYFPDAYELKVELDSSDWKIRDIETRFFEKLTNLKNDVKSSNEKLTGEMQRVDEQKKLMISEIENTRELVVKAEKEKFQLRNEIAKLQKKIEEMTLQKKVQVNKELIADKLEVEEEKKLEAIKGNTLEKKSKKPQESFSSRMLEEFDLVEVNVDEEIEIPVLEESDSLVQELIENEEYEIEKKKSGEINDEHAMPEFEMPEFEMPKFKSIEELEKVEVKKEGTSNYLFISVDKYLEGMTDRSKVIIRIIGETGVEKNVDLINLIEKDSEGNRMFYQDGKLLKNEFNNTIKNLRDKQFLDSHYLKLGSKGGYDYLVYKLSDIGQAVYYKLFEKAPVESEMDKVLGPHASLEHGYLIKEIADEFKDMGYKVFDKREDCTYDVGDGRRKVFDLIVVDNQQQKMHIEVERGTHNSQDFSNMLDKIYAVTQDIYIIAPSEKILLKEVKGKVFSWITNKMGGFENARGKVKFNFTTFEKLKQRKTKIWERFEP